MKIRRLLCSVICFCFLFCTACRENESIDNIIAETISAVTNIDPQIAENGTELEIVNNLFTGLLRHDENGDLIPAAAKSYTVSGDGLTYTFNLSDDYAWQDGKPLTANDFVFAFRRAADPATAAPYAYTLSTVANFSKINKGTMKKENLGVTAVDDKTLKITLAYKDTEFPELLTTSVCMPCREDFVESTKGYYGLKDTAILSNGEYKVAVWNDTYIQLKPKVEKSVAPDVYFYFNKRETVAENVKKQDTDYICADAALLTQFKKSNFGMNVTELSDRAYSLMANKNREYFNDDILSALMSTVDFSLKKYEKDGYGVKKTANILPDSVNSDIGEIKRTTKTEAESVQLFRDGCAELEIERIFPSFNILFVSDEITEYAAKQIAAGWQSKLGVNVNITAVDSDEILKYHINSGDYDFAIVCTKSTSCSATAYLRQLSSDKTFSNLGFYKSQLNKSIKKICKKSDTAKQAELEKAVKLVANDDLFYPLYTASKIVCTNGEYSFNYCRKQALVDFTETSPKE